jgi:hypothetical protein
MRSAQRTPRTRRLRRRAAGLLCAGSLVCGVGAAAATAGPSAGASHAAADTAGSLVAPQSDLTRFAVNSDAMVQAELIAVEYWNSSPCGGDVTVVWGSLDPSINATSDWWNPTEAYGNPAANRNCTITFNQVQDFDWPMFCTVMVHEIGHLTGHQHVTDDTSVMYPVYVAPIPQCTGAGPGAPVAAVAHASTKATPAVKRTAGSAHKAHSSRKPHKRKHTPKKHA